MLKFKYVFLTALCCLYSVASFATEVVGLIEFNSGTPALASEVNQNFSAIKNAVDDNSQRIDLLETSIDQTSQAVAISPFGFSERTNNIYDQLDNCQYTRISGFGYFPPGIANKGCAASADVQLPDKVRILSVSCLVFEDQVGDPDSYIYPVSLARVNLADASIQTLLSSSYASFDTGLQTITDSGIVQTGNTDDLIVDNSKYAYYLSVGFNIYPATTGSDVMKLHGCKVQYQP